MAQNTSHAVMAQRTEKRDSLDDFPTQPWATRALLVSHMWARTRGYANIDTVLEPACGRGHMAEVLREKFHKVTAFDIHDYGYKRALKTRDYTNWPDNTAGKFDWVITNPPFNRAEEFITRAMLHAKHGVAMFTRSTFTESVGRYKRLFSIAPPTIVAQFVERVVLHKGKLVRNGSTATAYCWLVWDRANITGRTDYVWIPPCRAQLERDSDYT